MSLGFAGEVKVISVDGSFQFDTEFANGTVYTFTVTSPEEYSCSAGGSTTGELSGDLTDLTVTCLEM